MLLVGKTYGTIMELHSSNINLGLKELLQKQDIGDALIRSNFPEALNIVQATVTSEDSHRVANGEKLISMPSTRNTMPMDEVLLNIVRKYGEKILLKASDRKPKSSKKKGKKRSSLVAVCREKQLDGIGDWQGPPPWDLSLGGDGWPKFLCDVMVRSLCYLCFLFTFPTKCKLLTRQTNMKKLPHGTIYISIGQEWQRGRKDRVLPFQSLPC